MRFIQKIAVMGLPLATALASVSTAYADPCATIGTCTQEQLKQGWGNIRNSVKDDTHQFSSDLNNSGKSLKNQARTNWNNASEETRQKWQAQRDTLKNTEKNARDSWNNADEATRKKWEAQRDSLKQTEQNARDKWNNAGQETRQKWQNKLTNAQNKWTNAGENSQKALQAQKDRLNADLKDATTLPQF